MTPKTVFFGLLLAGWLHFGATAVCAGQGPHIVLRERDTLPSGPRFHKGNDPLIRVTGRTQVIGSRMRMWQPGTYLEAAFRGISCEIYLDDEVLWGTSHNYIEVIVDHAPPVRLQTRYSHNTVAIDGLGNTRHVITLCKNTEAGIGYLDLAGMTCRQLVALPQPPGRRIECIGNSITCGAGMDLAAIPCGKGQWYDQHNAYMSYGARTARSLHAQWMLSSVSGIGLVHSCCKMSITMPAVFDKTDMRDDSIPWDFNRFVPDVVTICLGQNDGVQDSTVFCSAYVNFVRQIRSRYPEAHIICLNSPMADPPLDAVLRKYIGSVVAYLNGSGDRGVYAYYFSKQFHSGCGGHPDLEEHAQIARELTQFVAKNEHW